MVSEELVLVGHDILVCSGELVVCSVEEGFCGMEKRQVGGDMRSIREEMGMIYCTEPFDGREFPVFREERPEIGGKKVFARRDLAASSGECQKNGREKGVTAGDLLFVGAKLVGIGQDLPVISGDRPLI